MIGMSFFLGWLKSNGNEESGAELAVIQSVSETGDSDTQQLEDGSMEEERYTLMQQEYEKLERARRDLDRRLATIKGLMWGTKLPVEQAQQMTTKIKRGHERLKFKKFLGAFSDVQGINDELKQVVYADQALKGLVKELQAMRQGRSQEKTKKNELGSE